MPELGFGDLYLPRGGVVTVDGQCPTKVAGGRFLVECGPVIVWVPGPCLAVARAGKLLGIHMFPDVTRPGSDGAYHFDIGGVKLEIR